MIRWIKFFMVWIGGLIFALCIWALCQPGGLETEGWKIIPGAIALVTFLIWVVTFYVNLSDEWDDG